MLKKFFVVFSLAIAALLGAGISNSPAGVHTAYAGTDYYCGYDDRFNCDVYIDLSTARRENHVAGYPAASVVVKYTKGMSDRIYVNGDYIHEYPLFYTFGAGGYHKAAQGTWEHNAAEMALVQVHMKNRNR